MLVSHDTEVEGVNIHIPVQVTYMPSSYPMLSSISVFFISLHSIIFDIFFEDHLISNHMGLFQTHLLPEYLVPSSTGHPPCRLIGSPSPVGSML